MKISLFNEVWYDCYTALLNDIIYSIDNKRLDLIYNNAYKYDIMVEKMNSGNVFYSFQTISTNKDSLSKLIFSDRVDRKFSNKKKLVKEIIKLLKEGRLVAVHVDMFYYLPEITSIYHINHISHIAFVHGYDEEKKEFHVLERQEYTIPAEQLAEACLNENGCIWSIRINESVKLPSVTLGNIKEQSKHIVDSIEQIIFNRDDLWRIDSPTPDEIDLFFSISTTHLNNIKYRNYANAWLYENILNPNCIDNPFWKIGNEVDELRNSIMKYCKQYKWEAIDFIKAGVLELIIKEREIWKTL